MVTTRKKPEPEAAPNEELFQEAIQAASDGNHLDAISLFDQALEMSASDARCYGARASSKMELGNIAEALTDFEHARKLCPQHPPAYVASAECLRLLGRGEEAERILDNLLATVGEYGPALTVKGELQMESGRITEAVAAFRKAVKKDPNDQFATSSLAQALLRTGEMDESQALLEKLLEAWPDSARDWAALGLIKYQKQQLVESLAALTRAVEIDGNAHYHYQRAATLLQMGKEQDALLDLEYVINTGGDPLTVHVSHFLLGNTLCVLKRYEEAIPYFRLFLDNRHEYDSRDQVQMAAIELAYSLAKAGDRAGALKLLQQTEREGVSEELKPGFEGTKKLVDEMTSAKDTVAAKKD